MLESAAWLASTISAKGVAPWRDVGRHSHAAFPEGPASCCVGIRRRFPIGGG